MSYGNASPPKVSLQQVAERVVDEFMVQGVRAEADECIGHVNYDRLSKGEKRTLGRMKTAKVGWSDLDWIQHLWLKLVCMRKRHVPKV